MSAPPGSSVPLYLSSYRLSFCQSLSVISATFHFQPKVISLNNLIATAKFNTLLFPNNCEYVELGKVLIPLKSQGDSSEYKSLKITSTADITEIFREACCLSTFGYKDGL